MLIETAAVLAPFERLEIALPHVGIAAAVIIWNSGRYYGCEFEEPLSPATISAALLRSTPEGGPISLRGSPAPNSIPLEKRSARRSNAQSAAGRESYEAKWSLAASAWFILGTALGLWALIIGAVIAAMKLVEALWS
jgi:hypothetical protein